MAKSLDKHYYSIPQLIKENNYVFEDETIGIVSPTYAGNLPSIVESFLDKSTFKTNYLYFIATYGNDDTVICENTAKKYTNIQYANSVSMVDNYLPSYDMSEEKSKVKEIDKKIIAIKQDIQNRKQYVKKANLKEKALYKMVSKVFAKHPNLINGEEITITENCIGCGICSQVCPIGIIRVSDGKAIRSTNTCQFCLACVHHCPSKAIALKSGEKNKNERFRNEHISLAEIIHSNKQ